MRAYAYIDGMRPRRLVGRDREVRDVSESVASAPVTTLLGPGGVDGASSMPARARGVLVTERAGVVHVLGA